MSEVSKSMGGSFSCSGYTSYENNYVRDNHKLIADFVKSQSKLFSSFENLKSASPIIDQNFKSTFPELEENESTTLKNEIIGSIFRSIRMKKQHL